jgi:hypothetical protein
MLESYEHEISFFDLEIRQRICQHPQLITIRLEFMVKISLNVPIANRCTPFGVNINNIANQARS